MLTELGCDWQLTNADGNSVLMEYLDSFCNLQVVKYLLTKNDVNHKNKFSETAFMWACQKKEVNHEIVQMLVDHGADVN